MRLVSDAGQVITVTGAIALVILAFIAACFVGCERETESYAKLAGDCIAAGGSWVSQPQGAYPGTCIAAARR